MRCVVTGATGFIGSHLTESLLDNGFEVLCPVRDTTRLRYLRSTEARVITFENLEYELTSNNKLDYVFHLAGVTRALDYNGYRVSNVDLTKHFLDLVLNKVDLKFFKRFVFVSSQAVSGPASGPDSCITEHDPPNPVSLYGRSKMEAETLVREYGSHIPYVVIRPSTVFGPCDIDVLGVFKSCKYRIAPCLTGKDRKVSVIFVEDLVRGIKTAAFSERSIRGTYFITNPEPVVWRDFIREIAKVMGVRVFILPIPAFILRSLGLGADILGKFLGKPFLFRTEKIDEMDQWFWVCSSERASNDFGWAPQNSLRDNLQKTFNWYKNEGWL